MHSLKGKKQSPEHIRKRIEAIRKSGGFVKTPATREKIRQAIIGKKTSEETKQKQSRAAKALGIQPPVLFGEKHPQWKGDGVSYRNLHSWVERKLGKPQRCTSCGKTSEKKYDWANISRKYKRDTSDWVRLCRKCHKAYDSHKEQMMGVGS
jgi:hypothetical protein